MQISEKKVVNYTGEATEITDTFNDIRAYLIPLNHTNPIEGQHAVNNTYCKTSKVLHWNKETGVIETTYSIYVPVKIKENHV